MKQNPNKATQVKTEIDVELGLRWAWRDELSKRQTSAAEAVWDRIDDFGRHGGVDVDDGGGIQRYDFGEPHPDALVLERAVAELEPVVIDWGESIDAIAGPLAGLVDINDFRRQQPRQPKSSWGKAGDRALRGYFGPGGERPLRDRPRSMLMVGTFHPKALVIQCAAGGKRPEWEDKDPTPSRVLSQNGNTMVEGKCEGRNRYSAGSHCPIEWNPSPMSVIMGRANYAVWWQALDQIARTVELSKFTLRPPRAAVAPWFGEGDNVGDVIHVPPDAPLLHLPLAPTRGRMLSPLRRPSAGPVRYPLQAGAGDGGGSR